MADGAGGDIWSILMLAVVGIVPLAVLLLAFKPRPFKQPDNCRDGGEASAMSEVLKDFPRALVMPPKLEYPWELPRKGGHDEDRPEDDTLGKLVWRRIRNGVVEELYMMIPLLIGVLALVVAVIVVAVFS